MGRNTHFLRKRLAAGGVTIGQVRIEPGYRLTHVDDCGREDLKLHSDPHDAVHIARYDDDGRYRPLKTAANLIHGWRLELPAIDDVLRALDFLYPAAVGTACAEQSGELRPTGLRETLGRQTGMYAVTRKITDDQANTLITNFCHTGCLRKILWPLSEGVPSPVDTRSGESVEIPLLCAEACNLLVAEVRKVVKAGV